MIDAPVPAKILMTLADTKSTGEDFIALSGTLYRANLIFVEPRELRRFKNTLELTVTFQDVHSFKTWQKNSQVQQYWKDRFAEQLTSRPKTLKERDVIVEVDEVTNCTCKKSKFYVLQGRSLKYIDELVCSNCLGQIPYSRIPARIEIEDWQLHYQRVYLNWLDGGLFETEAYNHLTNYKQGKLNKKGETIRKALSDHFKIPVYINHFVYEPRHQNCPVCGQMGVRSGIKKPNKICKDCHTIFGYSDK